MKPHLLLIAAVFALTGVCKAQSVSPDVIACTGAFYTHTSGSVSWTLGEPMGETYFSANNYITQGFQQSWDFNTGVVGQAPVNAEAYPNPASDAVYVQFGAEASGVYVIEVYNALGQRLDVSQFIATPSARAQIDVSPFANGIYFIAVRKADGSRSSTFKITKNS